MRSDHLTTDHATVQHECVHDVFDMHCVETATASVKLFSSFPDMKKNLS